MPDGAHVVQDDNNDYDQVDADDQVGLDRHQLGLVLVLLTSLLKTLTSMTTRSELLANVGDHSRVLVYFSYCYFRGAKGVGDHNGSGADADFPFRPGEDPLNRHGDAENPLFT